MNVKPVFVLSRGAGVFVDQKGQMEMVLEENVNRSRFDVMLKEFKNEVGNQANILEELLVGDPSDFKSLWVSKEEIDVLFVFFLGVTPIEILLRWEGPIIAFSGQYTPAMALYALGDERRSNKDVFIAVDYEDIKQTLRVCEVKKLMADTRIVLMGFPSTWHLRWYGFPDLESVRRKLGVQFIPIELRELVDSVEKVDQEKAAAVAKEWADGAQEIIGPSEENLHDSAAAYLAMDRVLSRKNANAMAINCLEITQSPKFSDKIINPCMGMSFLRDQGIPSGCEMDITGLLTMITLGYLGRKPAFLGNIVRADPESNIIKLSHCILPSKMPGLDKPPLPYKLRDFHGDKGVTTFTEVPVGTEVTLARMQRNFHRVVALRGEITDCEDTTFCRHTVTIKTQNVREFIRQTEGNHQALIFGDYLDDLKALSDSWDCDFVSL